MIDMDTVSVISGFGKAGWRIVPQWQPYADLPPEFRNNPRIMPAVRFRYQVSVAGRLVVETLMDALRFFDRCDPFLTRRDRDGEIEDFPCPRSSSTNTSAVTRIGGGGRS
ncbi:hypothetical protein ACIBCD_42615 [Nocardia brasiliensis]|uniref:hypothetical protein n=1 Tax=Nocardia brasiliensis TaxID=37326 RepID=UPI00379BC303